MNDRVKARELVRTVEREQQQAIYHSIFARRVLHALAYFDMPRKTTIRRIKLLHEDDTVLDAFMSLGRLRRPPIVWTPPRPTLPKGCICFEWHHFRWFPQPSINARYFKPLTAKQEFAIRRDKTLRAEKRAEAERRRRVKAPSPPRERSEPPRTITTRYGRVVTVLPREVFEEEEEDGPSTSGT